jgi:putative holliday junction resolvase
MPILALDIGDKRIGIAVSDATEKMSFPVRVLHRTNIENDCREILKVAAEYNVRLIVAGLPRSLDGTIKKQAEKVQGFVDVLKTRTDIPIDYWNEWMSTKEAEGVLISSNVRREDRKKVIDKLAATLILDGYLRRMEQSKENEIDSDET